jgi:hypothetical protein
MKSEKNLDTKRLILNKLQWQLSLATQINKLMMKKQLSSCKHYNGNLILQFPILLA